MEDHRKHFQFLYDVNELQNCDKNDPKEMCKNLQAVLTAVNSDVNGEEMIILAPVLSKDSCPKTKVPYLT